MNRFLQTAVFAILIFVIAPLANAQNTGPVAPEAMSFEPVDATDMVNLSTGDMSYVIPLLTVPGPEGGYPLALSYHAGITMDQESSWVGLGWTVNPGAINRNVNGYPDDWNEKQTFGISYVSDAGNFTRNFVGIYLPLTQWGLPSIGLNYSWGTHRAFGGSVGYGVAGGIQAGIGFSTGDQGSSMTMNASYGGIGISAGNNGVGLSASYGGVGANINFEGGAISGGLGMQQGIISTGVSFSSEGINMSSNLGVSYISLAKAIPSDFGVKEHGWKVDLILFSFGKYKSNYWLYKKTQKFVFGTFYLHNAKSQVIGDYWGKQSKDYIMDAYSIPYDAATSADGDKADLYNNMMFPSYDDYSVSAQGLSGSVAPRLYEAGMLFGNGRVLDMDNSCTHDKDKPKEELDYHYNIDASTPAFTKPEDNIYFYFAGDNCSYLKINPVNFNFDTNTNKTTVGTGGDPESTTSSGKSFYDATTKRRGAGKLVEWFKNSELNTTDPVKLQNLWSRGFLEASRFIAINRGKEELFSQDGIGAFAITAEDGKTYHYSLPVYQFEEIIRQYQANKTDFIDQRKFDKYAYTWLLTSITGPDYIDRGADGNPNGFVDEYDWGYWVKFDYGKWTDGYVWQKPYDNPTLKYPVYFGRKQIYYLNSISTRTHIAYFIKDLKDDGLGKKVLFPSSSVKTEDNATHWLDMEDRYGYKVYECGTDKKWPNISEWSGISCNTYTVSRYQIFEPKVNYAHKTLKLSKIIIVSNKADNKVSNGNSSDLISGAPLNGGQFDIHEKIENVTRNLNSCSFKDAIMPPNFTEGVNLCSKPQQPEFSIYFQDNILDAKDIEGTTIESKALKVINFNYDYSLCQNTPNSNASGKLTLKSVEVCGKEGKKVIPPYLFDYYKLENNDFNIERKDYWGYDAGLAYDTTDFNPKSNIHNWSLKEITTPVGAKININYESDVYNKEAVYNGKVYKFPVSSFKLLSWHVSSQNIDNIQLRINLTESVQDLSQSDLFHLEGKVRIRPYDMFSPAIPDITINHNLSPSSINSGILEFDVPIKDIYYGVNATFVPDNDSYLMNISICGIKHSSNGAYYGGGLRVKEVNVTDGINNTQTISYDYNVPGTAVSSGITSYAPNKYEFYIPYESELVGPGVMYEYVTVKSKSNNVNSDSYKQYHFDVLKPSTNTFDLAFNMGEQFKVENIKTEETSFVRNDGISETSNRRTANIKNNQAGIGRLLGVKDFNSTDQMLQSIDYNYKALADLESMQQGLDQETFLYNKIYRTWLDCHNSGVLKTFYNSSSREYYPSVLDNVVTKANGLQATNTYNSFDFKTGNVLSTTTFKANGDQIKTEIIPAYYKYPEMGSKVDDKNNKNMLSQTTATYTYKVEGAVDKPLSASIQTWNNNWLYRDWSSVSNSYTDNQQTDVWRKCKSFVWKGSLNTDGTYLNFIGNGYDWTKTDTENKTKGWQKASEITRYNHYSAPLESKDINGNYVATKMGYNNAYVIANAGNANYNSFAYSGFEAEEGPVDYRDFGGEFIGDASHKRINATLPPIILPHTGDYFCEIDGKTGPKFTIAVGGDHGLLTGRKYKASVWMHKNCPPNASLVLSLKDLAGNDIVPPAIKKRGTTSDSQFGDWILLSVTIDVPASAAGGTLSTYVYIITPSAPIYIDDIRLQPIDAGVSAYAYNDAGNVSAILDNQNFAAKFEYDDAGRLMKTYKETPQGFKKVSEQKYKYAQSNYYMNFTTSDNPQTGMPVSFTALDAGNGAIYTWNFGDGQTANGQSVSNIFNNLGDAIYSVILTVTDADKKIVSVKKDIVVKDPEHIVITNPQDDSGVSKGSEVNFIWNGYPGAVNIIAQDINNNTPVVIATNVTGNSYKWVVPGDIAGTEYTITIKSADNTKTASIILRINY